MASPKLIVLTVVIGLTLGGGLWLAVDPPPAGSQPPDIRVILQTEAGITAYTVLTAPLSLDLVRPMLATVQYDNPHYLLGDYPLAGRQEVVRLAVGQAGWLIAYHPQTVPVARLYDCAGPGLIDNQPERALTEVLTALAVPTYTLKFYDYRYPQANHWQLYWLYTLNSTTQQGDLNLPLFNSYLERGYAFCTALSNSKFYLNGELIDQYPAPVTPVFHYGPLTQMQLRAGQTNTLRIEALSIFGQGLLGGVAVVYSGTVDLSSANGEGRVIDLHYLDFLGEPPILRSVYLPLVLNR